AGRAVSAAAGRLEDEAVAGLDGDRRDRPELDDLSVVPHDVVAARRTVAAAGQAEGHGAPAIRQDRRVHRRQELDLANDAVAAAMPSRAARASSDLEAAHAHRI